MLNELAEKGANHVMALQSRIYTEKEAAEARCADLELKLAAVARGPAKLTRLLIEREAKNTALQERVKELEVVIESIAESYDIDAITKMARQVTANKAGEPK
jgi:hypothetical protein